MSRACLILTALITPIGRFTKLPRELWEPLQVHELAHAWFDDSVTPERWSDLWLSEAHATWYGRVRGGARNAQGHGDLDQFMRALHTAGDITRALCGPAALPRTADTLFSFNVFYSEDNATTADVIHLVSAVAGRDLSAFLQEWLFGVRTPPMPGHRDWTVAPAPDAATNPGVQRRAAPIAGPRTVASELARQIL